MLHKYLCDVQVVNFETDTNCIFFQHVDSVSCDLETFVGGVFFIFM
jgi:hypothetical protein